jgi:hypothetical protein
MQHVDLDHDLEKDIKQIQFRKNKRAPSCRSCWPRRWCSSRRLPARVPHELDVNLVVGTALPGHQLSTSSDIDLAKKKRKNKHKMHILCTDEMDGPT